MGAANAERLRLEREYRAAGVADAEAFADARRAGKADPGPLNERKRAEQLETAIRHQDGLRVLRDRLTREWRPPSTCMPVSW